MVKRCSKCGEEKALAEFGKHKRRRDGIDTFCVDCRRAENRERMRRWRERNRERYLAQSRKDNAALKQRDPDYKRRWYERNAEKERLRSREVMRESRAKNPQAERERKRRYRERNAERVKEAEREKTYSRRTKAPYSPELAALMTSMVEEPCTYCGAVEEITVDHVVPLSRGGKHEADNLAPACSSCNSSKSDRLLSEWPGRLTGY